MDNRYQIQALDSSTLQSWMKVRVQILDPVKGEMQSVLRLKKLSKNKYFTGL